MKRRSRAQLKRPLRTLLTPIRLLAKPHRQLTRPLLPAIRPKLQKLMRHRPLRMLLPKTRPMRP